MRRWKSGLLYFSLKSVNPTNQPSLTFGQPSSPKLHSTSGLSSIKHQKDTKMSPVWQFLEGVTSAEPNQCFPWLNKDNWEQPPKCGGISAGWIPAAPDCACSFRRAPWWAVAAVVLSPNPWVWNMHVTAVCQVCPEALVPAPESVLVCSRTVCFSCSCGRICLFDSFTCTCYFLHTLLTLACGILSPKMCLHFFFKCINCSHWRCYLNQGALPVSPLTVTLLHKPLLCYSLTIISVTIELYWHQLPLKGSTDQFHVLNSAVIHDRLHQAKIRIFLTFEGKNERDIN